MFITKHSIKFSFTYLVFISYFNCFRKRENNNEVASTSSENHLFSHVNVEAEKFVVQTLLNMSGIDNENHAFDYEEAEIQNNTTDFVDKTTQVVNGIPKLPYLIKANFSTDRQFKCLTGLPS